MDGGIQGREGGRTPPFRHLGESGSIHHRYFASFVIPNKRSSAAVCSAGRFGCCYYHRPEPGDGIKANLLEYGISTGQKKKRFMGKSNLRCIPTRTRRGGSKSYDGGCLLDLVVSFSLFPDARWLALKMRSSGGPRHGLKRRIAAAHNRTEGLRSDLHLLVWDLPGGLVLSCMVR